MTKSSKLNSFSTILIAGISLFSLISCEKDTGDLGLNTLLPSDGLSVRYDSVNISGYQVVADNEIRTVAPYSKMLGSIVETLPNGQKDTITSEVDIPVYYEVYRDYTINSLAFPEAVYFSFRDLWETRDSLKEYIYGDENATIELIIEERNTTNGFVEYVQIDTVSYSLSSRKDSSVPPSFIIKLPDDIANRIILATNATMLKYPMDESTTYTQDQEIEIRDFFMKESATNGFRLRVKDPVAGFITRITTPKLIISFRMDESEENTWAFYFESPVKTVVSENMAIASSMLHHSIRLENGYESAFIQGVSGHKTKLDVSWLDTWLDSTNHTFNRATISFEPFADIDGNTVLDTLSLYMNRPKDTTVMFSYKTTLDKNSNTFSFDIADALNIFINEGVPTSEYSFELACPNNNLVANKVSLKYENGNLLNLTYTKY